MQVVGDRHIHFWPHNQWREVIRPDSPWCSAQYLTGSSEVLHCRDLLRNCVHCGIECPSECRGRAWLCNQIKTCTLEVFFPRNTSWGRILRRDVARPDSPTCSRSVRGVPQRRCASEAHFVSVCTVVLSVRRIVVEVLVDPVVNMATTNLPFFKTTKLECHRKSCEVSMSACRRAECSRDYTTAGNACRAMDCVFRRGARLGRCDSANHSRKNGKRACEGSILTAKKKKRAALRTTPTSPSGSNGSLRLQTVQTLTLCEKSNVEKMAYETCKVNPISPQFHMTEDDSTENCENSKVRASTQNVGIVNHSSARKKNKRVHITRAAQR